MTGESRLLFVHQTKFPSCLLERYGNSIRPLHATYKTTKYSLPLFFVVVKTNVDYQVVSSFVVQDETSAAITEPLKIIKKRNPKVQSKMLHGGQLRWRNQIKYLSAWVYLHWGNESLRGINFVNFVNLDYFCKNKTLGFW